jgi:(1->4)-alpha-D-glucan 1-alpha-D-glucosylmutase
MHDRKFPESTYRVQFHAGFTFRDAARLVPYLAQLGVTHLYASPYLKAAAGSTHGYDVIDHGCINPELGTDADFEAFTTTLADHGMAIF